MFTGKSSISSGQRVQWDTLFSPNYLSREGVSKTNLWSWILRQEYRELCSSYKHLEISHWDQSCGFQTLPIRAQQCMEVAGALRSTTTFNHAPKRWKSLFHTNFALQERWSHFHLLLTADLCSPTLTIGFGAFISSLVLYRAPYSHCLYSASSKAMLLPEQAHQWELPCGRLCWLYGP